MPWFSKLSVGAKLFAAFAAMLVLMGIMGSVAITKLEALNNNVSKLANNWMPAANAANRLSSHAARFRSTEYRHLLSEDDKAMDVTEKSLADYAKEFDKDMAEVIHLVASPEEKVLVDSVVKSWGDYQIESAKFVALSRKNEKAQAKEIVMGHSKELFNKMHDALKKESAYNVDAGNEEVKNAMAAYSMGRAITLTTLAFNIVLGMALAFWISRWFTKAIVQVEEISDSVAAASQELASASEQLSSGAQQSASSLEETASSLEEMTATVRQNADNATQANQLANNSRETAEKGGAVVAEAVKAMGEINQASKKIADIITTIDEIAFQTNLLALNAAVEAARAGEQGRGFAVVAGEVRNLAQRSATAAREIKSLIQDSVQKVENGSELVNRSGETLQGIVSSVKRVTDIVAEIAAASREQSAGIDQINKAVAQMDQVIQSNASQTEEMSGTANSLSGQADLLQAVVAQFNIKKQNAENRTALVSSTSSGSSVRRTPKKPVKTSPVRSAKLRTKSEQRMELVGAGVVHSHDGFEEF